MTCARAVWLAIGIAVVCPGAGVATADDEDEGEEDPDNTDPGTDGVEEEEEAGQPPVTAGGLFTIRSYPQRELFRPLTMTQKVTQLRVSVGADVSDKTAFEFFGVGVEGRYGYRDNFTLIGGFNSDYNFKGFSISAGFEGALAYDLFDIRLQANLNRVAQARTFDPVNNVPTDFQAGSGVQLSVDLGFPFRYVARPEIAIVALETLVSFDFNALKRGNGGSGSFESCQALTQNGMGPDLMNCTEDGVKPDLAPSIGIATNPVAALSVVLFAQLQIRDFDTTNQFTIPATAKVVFSPNQKLDVGLEFKFQNLKPLDQDGDGPLEAPKFFDQRFLNLFVQARY